MKIDINPFGDLDGDGKPEVPVQTSSQLYVWQACTTLSRLLKVD